MASTYKMVSYGSTGTAVRELQEALKIYIEDVIEEGPASGTDLRKGDIITKIDNTSVNKMCELQEYIFSKNAGDEIILNVIRDGNEKQVKVVLREK